MASAFSVNELGNYLKEGMKQQQEQQEICLMTWQNLEKWNLKYILNLMDTTNFVQIDSHKKTELFENLID